MGAGMAEFIEKEVETVEDFDTYCHYVAGLVGIGLSKVLLSLLSHLCRTLCYNYGVVWQCFSSYVRITWQCSITACMGGCIAAAACAQPAPLTPGVHAQLFASSGLEAPSVAGAEALANHMGLFLQKTNIIRDYLEDINEEPAPRSVRAERLCPM